MTGPRKLRHASAALATVLLLGACASAPKPDAELAAAERALAAAREAKAGDFAPIELGAAQEKLDAARAALNQRQNDRARVAAEQAQVDAELASAKARAAQARAAVQRGAEDNARLRRELLGEEGTP